MREIKFAQFHEVPFIPGFKGLAKNLTTTESLDRLSQSGQIKGLKMYETQSGVLVVANSREVLVPWPNVINVEFTPEDKPLSA